MTRRDEILEVAKVQIAERGYGGTSMRDIAEANGLLAGSLYSHFRSKAEIVRDIVIRFYDELIPAQEAVLEGEGTGAERFREMVGAVHAVCSRHREELTILHYDWHTLSGLDALADVHAQSLRTLDLWKEVIDEGKADGSIRATVDAEAMVRIATSSIHALIDTVRYATHPVPASGTAEAGALLQEVLLDGIATEGEPLMHDLLITGGLVVDGTGVPGRVADVAIADGRVVGIGRHRGEQAQRTIDADGLVVAPGIVDAHTHYDPQITWDGLCDTSALHGVTTVAAGNCGFGVAPCRSDDHEYLGQLFARVEGMDLAALDGIEWGFETFPEFLASRAGRLGLNFGMYVGHSAIRRWVLGDDAYEREATADEVTAMVGLVDEAMGAGALGFSSSLAPTHLDLADRPIPSRLASLDEVRALADAVGRHGRGSIAFAPESAVEGISPDDRDLLIELARRGGVPSITQGLGGRSKVDAPTKAWAESRAFLDRSAELGTPVFSLLMTRALNGPFTVAEGTSRYEGVPTWHRLMTAPIEEKRRLLADPDERERLRHGIDHPNLDPAKGTTLPPPFWESLRLSSTSVEADQRWMGRAMADIAAERRVHPADALLDLALADDLQAVFHWSNETPAWRELLKDVQKHPQMIVGVSDGGAHLDRDDGQEWSTHFLATWWRSEQVWRLEEAIRLMTAIPAAILGLADRGVLATGRPADVFLFDPERVDVGTCRRQEDPVLGVPRFRGVPVGIEATIVNGTVVVERGERLDARPGQVVRPS